MARVLLARMALVAPTRAVRRARPSARWWAWLLAAGLGACAPAASPIEVVDRAYLPVPVADDGEVCADLSAMRVCWAGRRALGIARSTPRRAASSALGWRCVGKGPQRQCRDRLRDADAFACSGGSCLQRQPRFPDDGEWSCADMAGATICLGGQPAAGVPAASASPGWLCGVRRRIPKPPPPRGDHARPPEATVRDARGGERVCVDLSPDFPDGQAGGWRCRFQPDPGGGRVCDRDGSAHVLGDSCDRSRPCVDGSGCVAGRCVPPRPAPSCWVDDDCPGRACRFGSCREEGWP